jgi:hypothetical protein
MTKERASDNEEIVLINPLYPPILGDFLKLGDTPRPPAGSILHLFFSGLYLSAQDHTQLPGGAGSAIII